jgi:hypothetical protein
MEMTEAGGLIIAAIIAGVVAIVAAIITAIVSFLSLIISKEQSVSEHRQQWIDALRKDIALIVGRVIAIHGESIVEQDDDDQDKLWARLKADFTGFNRVIVRIRLRLNPNENSEGEKQETEAVLKALDELESTFRSRKPRFDRLEPLIKTLVDNAQVILKENWNRVRDGEPVYKKAKRNTWIAVKVFAVLGIVAIILSGLCWFKVICH